jgi:hypothetical protein
VLMVFVKYSRLVLMGIAEKVFSYVIAGTSKFCSWRSCVKFSVVNIFIDQYLNASFLLEKLKGQALLVCGRPRLEK